MITIVDLDTGQVLGVVDGRDDKGCRGLAVRPAPAVAPERVGRRDSAACSCCTAATHSAAESPSGYRKCSPSTIQPAPSTPPGKSRNSSGSCSAPGPWTTRRRQRRYSRNWSRQPPGRKPTGSTTPSAGGGSRGADHHRRHDRQGGGQQYCRQEQQTHGARLPQPCQLQIGEEPANFGSLASLRQRCPINWPGV